MPQPFLVERGDAPGVVVAQVDGAGNAQFDGTVQADGGYRTGPLPAPPFTISAAGVLGWSNGVGPVDVTLQRSSAGVLNVTGTLNVNGAPVGGSSYAAVSNYVTAGDQTLSNVGSTWTSLTSLQGFTIAAAVGDRIRFKADFLARLLGVNFLDQAVMVGGSAARYASTGTNTAAIEGDPTAYRDSGDSEVRGMGVFSFVVTSGDLDGGNVVIDLRYKGTGTTSVVYSSSNYPARYLLENMGS